MITRTASQLTEFVVYVANCSKAADSAAVRLKAVTARDITPGEHNHPVFHLRVEFDGAQPWESDVSTAKGVFAVETFLPFTQQLAEHLGVVLRPDSSASSDDPVTALLEVRAAVLVQANATISAQLKAHFNDPDLHERAAFLLEAFSWRDASGKFFNLLPELSRIAAHRVFAVALRGNAGEANDLVRLNRALNDELLGLDRDAVMEAEKLPDQLPWKAWSRTIRMRATQNWRVFLEANDPTLLERLEWYRLFAAAVGTEAVQKSYTIPEDLEKLPDWWRFLNLHGPSVSTGHLLSNYAIQSELAEAHSVFSELAKSRALPKDLVSALNARETNGFLSSPDSSHPLTPEVIGWDVWAQFIQRHLCASLCDQFHFLQEMWGVPEKARSFRSWADDNFQSLALYPFVRRLNATADSYYRQAQDACIVLVRQSPELCPAFVWNQMSYRTNFGSLYVPKPHPFINEWHFDNPLPGTVYDIGPRISHPSLTGRTDFGSLLKQLSAAAPHQGELIYYSITDGWKSVPSPEQAISAYGDLLETHPFLQGYIADLYANQHKTAEQEEWLTKESVLNPRAFSSLADLYIEQKRYPEAAHAFEQWIANETDEVSIANKSEWLVNYYEDNGASAEATSLARRCGEIYSMRGLLTEAHLFERRKKYDDALSIYQKENDRYETPGAVIGFLLRHQVKNEGQPFEPELLNRLLETYFPHGLERFKPEGFLEPSHGVRVPASNREIERSGFLPSDIIVALRGYAVTDWSHFKILRDFQNYGVYDAVVWRNGRLITVSGIPSERRFGVDFATFRKTPPIAP